MKKERSTARKKKGSGEDKSRKLRNGERQKEWGKRG